MSKRRHKPKITTIRTGEQPTKERRQQDGGVISEVVDRDYSGKIYIKRYKATSNCMLDAYLWFKKITVQEHEAGMKFRRAYLRAVLRVRVEDQGSGCHADKEMAHLMVFKSERILKEAYAVLSPAQKAIILTVCGDDTKVGDTYRFETFHRALAKLIEIWKIN